jgi:hypothetical protein
LVGRIRRLTFDPAVSVRLWTTEQSSCPELP